MAEDPKSSSGPVEVIVQGKQYKSIRAYKQEQMKDILSKSLASYDLMEFSEDELYEMMKDIRKRQRTDGSLTKDPESDGQHDNASPGNQATVEQDAGELKTSQIQEMLQLYHSEHQGANRLSIDPDKVKTVIINPRKKAEDTPEK